MHKMMHPSSWKKKGAENKQLWLTFIIYIYIYIYIYINVNIHIYIFLFFLGGGGVGVLLMGNILLGCQVYLSAEMS